MALNLREDTRAEPVKRQRLEFAKQLPVGLFDFSHGKFFIASSRGSSQCSLASVQWDGRNASCRERRDALRVPALRGSFP